MTEQEHTLKLVVGVLSAASHMLDAARTQDGDTPLDVAASDALDKIHSARHTLSRGLSTELLRRTPKAEQPRTLASDLAEDRF
jgi:hypothetical protein